MAHCFSRLQFVDLKLVFTWLANVWANDFSALGIV